MGLLGYVAAGALQGLGQGIQNTAAAQREAALAAMRQKYQVDKDQRAAAQHTAERQEDRENVLTDYKTKRADTIEDSERGYTQKAGLLAVAGQVQQGTKAIEHTYTMEEIGARAANDRQIAVLNNRLGTERDAATINLKEKLDSGDFKSTVVGKDGNYYGVTDRGLVPTGVTASETAAAQGDRGGGRLTEGEQTSAYEDDRKAWREGGKKGAEPKKSDYIGMTRQAYSTRGAGGAAATPTPAAPAQKAQPAQVAKLYEQAATKAARGEPGWKGLTQSQIKKKVDDLLKASGY